MLTVPKCRDAAAESWKRYQKALGQWQRSQVGPGHLYPDAAEIQRSTHIRLFLFFFSVVTPPLSELTKKPAADCEYVTT